MQPPRFLTEIRSDVDARFWEMYLACALLDGAELNRGRIWVGALTREGHVHNNDSFVIAVDRSCLVYNSNSR